MKAQVGTAIRRKQDRTFQGIIKCERASEEVIQEEPVSETESSEFSGLSSDEEEVIVQKAALVPEEEIRQKKASTEAAGSYCGIVSRRLKALHSKRIKLHTWAQPKLTLPPAKADLPHINRYVEPARITTVWSLFNVTIACGKFIEMRRRTVARKNKIRRPSLAIQLLFTTRSMYHGREVLKQSLSQRVQVSNKRLSNASINRHAVEITTPRPPVKPALLRPPRLCYTTPLPMTRPMSRRPSPIQAPPSSSCTLATNLQSRLQVFYSTSSHTTVVDAINNLSFTSKRRSLPIIPQSPNIGQALSIVPHPAPPPMDEVVAPGGFGM